MDLVTCCAIYAFILIIMTNNDLVLSVLLMRMRCLELAQHHWCVAFLQVS